MIYLLCVDDEKDSLDITKAFLEKEGDIAVQAANSAEKALELLINNHYDAIVSDYQMPGIDGIEFLKIVRERFGEIPFILFTGRGREEVAILALNSGADFYLQKAGDLISLYAELKNKIEKAVGEQRSISALKNSEHKLSDIINFLPDPTFAIDNSGIVISWNKAMEEMTGVFAEDILGKGEHSYAIPIYGYQRPVLIDLINGYSDEILGMYQEVRKSDDIYEAESFVSYPDGYKKYFWIKTGLLYDQKGQVTGAIESIRNITEKKEIDKKLIESEERYRTLAESSQDLVYIINEEDRIVYVNTCAANALKMDKKTIIGKPRSYFFPDSSNSTQWSNIKKVIDSGESLRVESRVVFKDKITWQDTLLIPLKDQNGDVTEIMGVTRDLTKRYESEMRLKKVYDDLKALITAKADLIKYQCPDLFEELINSKIIKDK